MKVRPVFELSFFLLTFLLWGCAQFETKENARAVSNPYALVWENFHGKEKGLVRFFADINNDRSKDLFVGALVRQRESGGPFQVFINENGRYLFLGTLERLNPFLLEVLPGGSKKDFRLKTLLPENSETGRLYVYRYDGQNFVLDLEKEVKGQFMEEIDPVATDPEVSDRPNWQAWTQPKNKFSQSLPPNAFRVPAQRRTDPHSD